MQKKPSEVIEMKLKSASYGRLSHNAKCSRCRAKAIISLPSHHANFCEDCFLVFFHKAVNRAMKKFPIRLDTPIMVAVSGGKDSLALWDVLADLGFTTKGIHIDLGIPNFSEASRSACEEFAKSRGLELSIYELKDLFGFSLPEIAKLKSSKVCSVCGTLKRQFLNRLALQEGFSVIATGHNLDDEASRLLGNTLRHRDAYLQKAYPFLPAGPGLVARMKPLFRLESEEIRIYCRVRGIKYFGDKCPFARGATSHILLEALQFIESQMPGTKRDFLFGFLDRQTPPQFEDALLGNCSVCGALSYQDTCSVCRLKDELKRKKEFLKDRGH